jgi:hypothetical protein
MTYLFNKLDQAYVGTNKPFHKDINAFGSSGCCHSTKEISTEVTWYPKVLDLVQPIYMLVRKHVILRNNLRLLVLKFFT